MGFAVAIVFLVLAAVVALGAIKIVPQGREYTVERFGRYTRSLKPGMSFLTPFVEGVGRKINMMEQVLDVPRQDVITKDNVSVQVDAIVFIQVMDAAAAAYRVTNLDFAITQLTMTNLRTVVGNMELDEVLSQRDQINTRLLDVIDQATSPWGVKVARIEIKDLQPPPDITNAMARQMKAERERRAVITEADGEKQAAITVAEGQKQSAILQAEGRREAAFRDAEARERAAAAEAKATELVSNAIADGDVNAINYFVAQKYVEAFAKLADSPQQRTVIVPADLASLVGSIAGVGELVKTARAEQQQPPAARPRTSRGGSAVPPTEAGSCPTARSSISAIPSGCGWRSPPPSWRSRSPPARAGSCHRRRRPWWSRSWPSSPGFRCRSPCWSSRC
jgi:regulator of protease activity HflC (stomatin/prohibitin superfamily)